MAIALSDEGCGSLIMDVAAVDGNVIDCRTDAHNKEQKVVTVAEEDEMLRRRVQIWLLNMKQEMSDEPDKPEDENVEEAAGELVRQRYSGSGLIGSMYHGMRGQSGPGRLRAG